LILIAVAGLALRLWSLGDKGLSYDEAATALMARAPATEIVQFHWNAAFEHPPLWQLAMRTWTAMFGQSEAMLRLLPALAGALAIPLTWYWLRLLWPRAAGLRLLAAGLVATSPALVVYAQEARMYTVVVLLALLSLILLVDLVERPGWATAALFAVINWLMLGYHYYSLLLVGCEAIFLLLLTAHSQGAVPVVGPSAWRSARWWDAASIASIVPIVLWMLFSPGFYATFAIVTGSIGGGAAPAAFFDGIWRDLSFGDFRWQPELAVWGYLLAPLVAIGAVVLVRSSQRQGARAPRKNAARREGGVPWGWLVTMVGLLPLVVSVVLFRTLAARYVLFVLPAIYTLAAAGVVWLGRRHWALAALGIVLAAVPLVLGLGYYFGAYHKSEYREMAAYLREHVAPDEAIMLYAPRQHLLAKYYLGEDRNYYTAPQVELPPYWPVNAPPVVPEEMDGQIQDLLATHGAVWLVMTAQDEVDDGEFVPKYLTAVAYKQECRKWLDVELCRFVSPQSSQLRLQAGGAGAAVAPGLLYNKDLRLERAQATLVDEADPGQAIIYVQLDWLAERKPSIDYRITLRLLDSAGQVVAQRDEFPIGQLLPPTTWNSGDAKPGYMALPLPGDLAPGNYRVTVNVYDPNTGETFAQPVEIAQYVYRNNKTFAVID
jgi:uncharacterized membrane protein